MQRDVPGGLFITFEGPECSGKTTQTKLLLAELAQAGYQVLPTREPGGTRVGEELRHLVKHVVDDEAVCAEAELFIFSASRAQLTRRVILPHLETGGIVVCDRYHDSTTAYQGYARGFPLEYIRELHRVATCGRFPDLTILMDLPVEAQLDRGRQRVETLNVPDRFDAETREFHQKVREGYRAIAAAEPERVKIVDATAPVETIHSQIMSLVHDALARRL